MRAERADLNDGATTRLRHDRAAARLSSSVPMTFTSNAVRHDCQSLSSIRAKAPPYVATLTRTSIRPKRAVASSTSARHEATSARSAGSGRTCSTCLCRHVLASTASRSASRAATITSAPARPRAVAQARPMPGPAPATTATIPWSSVTPLSRRDLVPTAHR